MYVEILCPRCMAAVSGRTLSDRPSRFGQNPATAAQIQRVVGASEAEDSLTETDIVETQPASGEGGNDD
jgi:hypothetical protein